VNAPTPQRVRDLVVSDGIATAPHFAVGVSHFEGWGAGESVSLANPGPVLALLAEQGLLPEE
jgi:hypothetical protein